MGARACRWLGAAVIVAVCVLDAGAGAAVAAGGSASGSQLWVQRYAGPGSAEEAAFTDGVGSVAVSPNGATVFVTGANEAKASGLDYVTVAYDAARGKRRWVARYNGPANGPDGATSVAVSPDGATVFVTGGSLGQGSGLDDATVAYDAATGSQRWVARYDGPASQNEGAGSIAVDPRGGKVFVSGTSEGPATASGATKDYATIAYDTATGAQLWVTRYPGSANRNDEKSMGVSADGGTVFVTGWSEGTSSPPDYATVAYDAATGAQRWEARYDGPAHLGDEPAALAVDPKGRQVFVTGSSSGTESGPEYATVAYDAATGAQSWVTRYRGPSRPIAAQSVAVNAAGTSVFVTGSAATLAYDAATGAQRWRASGGFVAAKVSPDGAKVFVTGSKGADYVTAAYDAATGKQRWTKRYNGPAKREDSARAVAVSPNGRTVFVEGSSQRKGAGFDYATIAYRA